MCVAIAGIITEIDNTTAKVDINNNIVNVNIKLVKPKIGDYVLVHAGMAVEIITKQTADEISDIYRDILND